MLGREFDHEELVERIRTVARRPPVYRAGELTVDEESRIATLGGRRSSSRTRSSRCSPVLASEPDRVFTRTELLREIWDWPPHTRTRTLDAHASRLRRKLRAFDPATPWIDNEWGVGYRLDRAAPGMMQLRAAGGALELEQAALRVEPARVAGERAVRADDPVAGRTIGIGLRFITVPTARAAFGRPTSAARWP